MDLKLFLEQIKKFFNTLTRSQKIVLFSSTGVLIIGIIFIFIMSSKINYAPLFTNLNQQDAASIISYLEQKKIDYKLVNGTTIEVPKDKVYKLRLDLVAAGLPKHGVVGFEIFDKQSFGTTNFVENINYIRALEGELTRTIDSIGEVKSARVNLAIPKPTIFTEEQSPPTASVVLNLYSPLSRNQIIAIQKLVAASVPRLTYKNVTIVDSNGNLLSKNENEEALLTADELKYKSIIEKEYVQRIKNLLTPILGKGKFVAGVDVELDLSKVKKTSIVYDPNSVVVSEENEESSSTAPANGGTPGVISNVGNNTKTVQSQSKTSKSKSITNYDVGRTETITNEPLIKIKRISAAIVVDGIYEPVKNKKGKIIKYKYQPQNPQTIQLIKDAVMKAIGYNKARGDQVSVSSMQFLNNKTEAKAGGGMNVTSHGILLSFVRYYKYALMALLLFIFYFLFLRKFIKNTMKISEIEKEKRQKAKETAMEEEEVKGKSVREIEQEIATQLEKEENIDEGAIKSKVMEDKIREKAQQNPEEVANLIKTILTAKNKQ